MTIKFNGWTKWVIFIVMALVALGGYVVTVRSNTKRVSDCETKAEVMETAVTKLQTHVEWIVKGIARIETAVAAKNEPGD